MRFTPSRANPLHLISWGPHSAVFEHPACVTDKLTDAHATGSSIAIVRIFCIRRSVIKVT